MHVRQRFFATLGAALTALALIGAAASASLLPGSSLPATTTTSVEADAASRLTRGFPEPSKTASLAALDKLKVANDGSMAGYSREKFSHWRDASTYGWPVAPSDACTAREAALFRDGTGVKVNPSTCAPTAGRWLDPYTATWLTKPTQIQIDHVVPLAEAWRTGAARWTANQRTAYANAPLVLVSAEGRANGAKGDKGPEAWKPTNKASHCLYAKRWIAVKATYKLTTSAPEKTALTGMLNTCSK